MIAGRHPPVRWVCHSAYRNTASTVMRTDQLIAIAREHVGDDIDYIIDDEESVLSARDSILWLTKGFIRRADPELLDQLEKVTTSCAPITSTAWNMTIKLNSSTSTWPHPSANSFTSTTRFS